MSSSNVQTYPPMTFQSLKLLGLTYVSIGEDVGVSHTTVRRVLLNVPGHFAGPALRKKIWARIRKAKSEAKAALEKMEIPECEN